jgi:DNA-binding transcriptional ArsR family regulator
MKKNDGDEGAAGMSKRPETGQTTMLADGDLYPALTNETRRRLLYYLTATPETTVENITTVLVGWEVADEGSMATPADHERLRTVLEHVHLPVLAERGLIEYDRDSGTVAAGGVDESVVWLLEQSVKDTPE